MNKADLVPAQDVNIAFPQMVIAYYEKYTEFLVKTSKYCEKYTFNVEARKITRNKWNNFLLKPW